VAIVCSRPTAACRERPLPGRVGWAICGDGRRLHMPRFFVVTGLPASGKTTVGSAVAMGLQLPFIDKDAILETMFDENGIGDSAWRAKLSRSADLIMQRKAQASSGAVIVSWWRHPASGTDSGTSTEWLRSLPGEIVEIHCRCAPEVAVDRFFARRRHPGHLDEQKSRARELQTFAACAALGPVGTGRVLDVCTNGPVDVQALVAQLIPLQP
jgi:gluconate kinase